MPSLCTDHVLILRQHTADTNNNCRPQRNRSLSGIMGTVVSTQADSCLMCLCFGHDSASFNDDDRLSDYDGDDVVTALPYGRHTRSTTPTRGISSRDRQNDDHVAGAGNRAQRESAARLIRRFSSPGMTGELQHHEENSRGVRRNGSLQERTYWMEKMVSRAVSASVFLAFDLYRQRASYIDQRSQSLPHSDDAFALSVLHAMHRVQQVQGGCFVGAETKEISISRSLCCLVQVARRLPLPLRVPRD